MYIVTDMCVYMCVCGFMYMVCTSGYYCHPPPVPIIAFHSAEEKLRALPIFAHMHFVELITCSLLVVIPTLGDVPKPCYKVSSFLRGISARTQSRRWIITTGMIIFGGTRRSFEAGMLFCL